MVLGPPGPPGVSALGPVVEAHRLEDAPAPLLELEATPAQAEMKKTNDATTLHAQVNWCE